MRRAFEQNNGVPRPHAAGLHEAQVEAGDAGLGNTKTLLRLRRQIDRALEDEDRYPLDDALYRDEHGEEYEAVARRAKSREEMRGPVLKPEDAPRRRPWTEVALEQEMARKERKRQV